MNDLYTEALELADVLEGMTEGSVPENLWEADQPDGDGFVRRAAQVLRLITAERDALSARVKALEADIENYLSVAMAAAVEIQEHWDAHCDEDGYGPANLMRRLENGFPASYGYTAKSLVEVTADRDALQARLDAMVQVPEPIAQPVQPAEIDEKLCALCGEREGLHDGDDARCPSGKWAQSVQPKATS